MWHVLETCERRHAPVYLANLHRSKQIQGPQEAGWIPIRLLRLWSSTGSAKLKSTTIFFIYQATENTETGEFTYLPQHYVNVAVLRKVIIILTNDCKNTSCSGVPQVWEGHRYALWELWPGQREDLSLRIPRWTQGKSNKWFRRIHPHRQDNGQQVEYNSESAFLISEYYKFQKIFRIILAHNGAKFDSHFITTELVRRKIYPFMIANGHTLMLVKLQHKKMNNLTLKVWKWVKENG